MPFLIVLSLRQGADEDQNLIVSSALCIRMSMQAE